MRTNLSKMVVALALVGGCGKDDKPAAPGTGSNAPAPTGSDGTGAAPAAGGDAVAKAGVEAGGIEHAADEGPAALATKVTGTVTVRHVGETEFAPLAQGAKLFPGDQVKTGEASTATLGLADESTVEVAEVSTVGIASRNGTADPASAAAVLSGVARFSVAARAPGEGAFRVYTPKGVIVTTGTVYGVGVGASGEARVGVESGSVDVFGLAAFDGDPVSVSGGNYARLGLDGTVAAPVAWPDDDWGTWRDEADAKVELVPAIDAHATAMTDLEAQLAAAYADLDATAQANATFEATASASADANDPAKYEAALPEGSATIDASFDVAGRAEALTWAHAGHAELATEIYVRHPKEVEARWVVVAPHVDAAVLWPKRFEITASGYLEPLRTQYYVHHPRGRVHAELVGVTVPTFYAAVEPPEIDPIKVRGHVKTKIWLAPHVKVRASTRPIWIAAPAPTWHTNVRFVVGAPRAKVAWYVRPPTMHAHVIAGANVSGRWVAGVKVKPAVPRATVRAAWKVPVGMKVKIGAPDLGLAVRTRAKVKIGADGRLDHRAHMGVGVGAMKPPAVKLGGGVIGGGGIKIGGGAKAKVGGGAVGKIGGGIGVGMKVKAPAVKIKAPPPPKVKVKAGVSVKAKGGIKIR